MTGLNTKDKILLISIILFGYLLKIIKFFFNHEITRDGGKYLQYIQIWYDTDSFSSILRVFPSYYVPPLYFYIVKSVMQFGLQAKTVAIVVNIIIGSLVPVPVFCIVKIITNNIKISLIASFLIAINPSIIELSLSIQRDIIYLFISGFFMYFMFSIVKHSYLMKSIICGITVATALFCRFEAMELIVWYFFAILFCIFKRRFSINRAFMHTCIFLISLAFTSLILIQILGIGKDLINNFFQYCYNELIIAFY